MKKIIYADNAATTKLDEDAFEAMKPFLLEEYANPSQPYSFSRRVKKAIKEARATIAECINASPEEIYFTSGGTESDNWAIKNFADLNDMHYIITSPIEHHAVLHACQNAGNYYNLKMLSIDNQGFVERKSLVKSLKDPSLHDNASNTTLVSVMLANNEIGTVQPIKELAKTAHEYGAYFHTDAVQAVGHIPVDVKDLNVDMLSASGHKFNGPKGIGFLYWDKNNPLQPFHDGGAQEFGMRAGTENVASIVGMAVALKNNFDNMNDNISHLHMLTKRFNSRILRICHYNSYFDSYDISKALPGLISISFKGITGEAILHRLDLKGICVSTGSACDSVNQKLSHVISAVTSKEYEDFMHGTIRISLSRNNTVEDVDAIADAINEIISKVE